MNDEQEQPLEFATAGGTVASHEPLPWPPLLVGPATGSESNAYRAGLIPFACWRIEDIRFDFDSSLVKPDIVDEIRQLARLTKAHPECPLSIFGHADPAGDDAYNKKLSGRRSQAIYALLTREVSLWEDLYSNPHGRDDWRIRSEQIMLQDLGYAPGRTDGTNDQPTRDALKQFQQNAGLAPSGNSDAATREKLFLAYMNSLCGPLFKLKKEDFLGRGQDADGKADYQGCSEFNPAMVFSQQEHNRYQAAADKTERNLQNTVNRRVVIYLFRKGSKVLIDKWPCPTAKEGDGQCRTRFWSDGEQRRARRLPNDRRQFPVSHDTFACRFYHRLATSSPCEAPSQEAMYHVHVDADRDGRVDDDWQHNNQWEWGAAGKGAIILCNNDDDDRNRRCDNEDATINQDPDPADVAPLVIRRLLNRPVAPPTWKGFLEVAPDQAQFIRIFESHAPGANEIIGPNAGHQYELPTLSFNERTFGMEGVQYPDADFGGEITITLRIDKGGGNETREEVKVRVAPWVVFNHFYETKRVYVVNTGDNSRFRSQLQTAMTAAGVTDLETVAGPYRFDRWIQDAMEIGFSTLPKDASREQWSMPVVLREAKDRTINDDTGRPFPGLRALDQYPKREILAPDYGFTQAVSRLGGTSLDSFGNLECTPPFTHRVSNKEYKFGRAVYGMDFVNPLNNMQEEVVEFLLAQQVQDPFPINTGWLAVGHVDEVVSFCPMQDAPLKFRVLLASPDKALEILQDLQDNGQGTARMFQGIHFTAGFTASRLATEYARNTPDLILADALFMSWQATCQGIIDGIRDTLKDEVGLEDEDFIELPVLFQDYDPAGNPGQLFIAYTPGVVNALVLTKSDQSVHLGMPKPFGPMVGGVCQFENAINALLGPVATTGVEISYIDCFATYHVQDGEVHCGTNSKRKPPTDRWWWEQEV
jgi:protein-arginine deiminase